MKECIREYNEKNLILRYDLQWFASGEGGEKTEPATAKKLEDARKEGKVAKSKELTAAFDLIVLFLVLKFFVTYVGESMLEVYTVIYSGIADFVSINRTGISSVAVSSYLRNVIIKYIIIVIPFFIFGVVITLLISIYQVGWKVTSKPLQPKLDKFNPINGFKRIFSKDSLFELIKSVFKIGLIAYVAYTSISGHKDDLFVLYDITLQQAVGLVGEIIINAGLKISIVYLLVGIADFAYHKHKFNEDMKMTKQEVKDEYKNAE